MVEMGRIEKVCALILLLVLSTQAIFYYYIFMLIREILQLHVIYNENVSSANASLFDLIACGGGRYSA